MMRKKIFEVEIWTDPNGYINNNASELEKVRFKINAKCFEFLKRLYY